MVNFDYTEFDAYLLDLTREQAKIAGRYARHYDHNKQELVADEVPETKDAMNPRKLLRDRADETSGHAMMEALLALEETTGGIFFHPGNNHKYLGSDLVSVLGTPEQVELFKDTRLAIAVTEPGCGSDPSHVRTTAVFDEEAQEWVLNGEKIFISVAHIADGALVFARFEKGEEKGLGIFVMEKATPGFTVGPKLNKMGQRTWDTGDLVFQDCRIPAINRIEGNMKHTLSVFNSTRPMVAAFALGYSKGALDFTREKLEEAGYDITYADSDGALNCKVKSFLELEAQFEASRLSLLHAKWIEDTSAPDKIEASVVKISAGQAAREIIRKCMDILGPEAMSENHNLEIFFRDSRVCDIYEGAGEVNRIIVAREVLGYSAPVLN